MALNGRALAIAGIGSIFVWSGIKGWSILATVGDLATGKKPSQVESSPLVSGMVGGGSFGSAPGGLAATALQYQGHAYRFGGAPGKDGSKPWDCSSFVNWVASTKAGLSIPGYGPGKYDGGSHGPPCITWAYWPGLTRISKAELQSGDLVIWSGHMGIALGPNEMISALNPQQGTKVTPIEGYGNGPLLTYGRFK